MELFDKARKAGGRLSTRRVDELTFDHGASYFTVRDPGFELVVDQLERDGVVAPWNGRVAVMSGQKISGWDEHPRWVGTPTMSAIPRALSEGLLVRSPVRITEVSRVREGFVLGDAQGNPRRAYDQVLLAVPSAQAVPLLAEYRGLAGAAEGAQMLPCVAAMLAFDEPLDLEFDAAFIHDAPLTWVCRQGSKPGRPSSESWVLHASPTASEAILAEDFDTIARELASAFERVLGRSLPEPRVLQGHRWRYARATKGLAEGYAYDRDLGVGVCGDWCLGARVEDAWISGDRLARAVLANTVHGRKRGRNPLGRP